MQIKRTKQKKARSPLVPPGPVRRLSSHSVCEIRKEWLKQFGIDIGQELRGLEEVELYQCIRSGLKFFHPGNSAGSSRLYRDLSKGNWYYPQEKWEYDRAASICRPQTRVLEVGCGSGEFLKILKKREVKGMGLEINREAIKKCRSEGLEVRNCRLSHFSSQTFETVCAFQVLEHLPNPLEFLKHCVRVLRPGGKLILATPNSDSLLLQPPILLDMPPHHMTGWNERAYKYLEKILPVSMSTCRQEPLAKEHVDWWMNKVRQESLAPGVIGQLINNKFIPKSCSRRLLMAGGRFLVPGQGMLVCFVKKTIPRKTRIKNDR